MISSFRNMLKKLLIIHSVLFLFIRRYRHCFMKKSIHTRSENVQKTFLRTDSQRLYLVCAFDLFFLT